MEGTGKRSSIIIAKLDMLAIERQNTLKKLDNIEAQYKIKIEELKTAIKDEYLELKCEALTLLNNEKRFNE